MRKKPVLTPREERIAIGVASGKLTSQAIRDAGGNPESSSYRARLSPGGDMHAAVMAAWRKQGLTLAKVARRHVQALDAKETRFFHHEGEVIETHDVIAHGPRLQAVELAYKVAGVLGRDDRDPQPASVTVTFALNLSPPAKDVTPGNGNGHHGNGHGTRDLGLVLRSLGLTVRADRGDGVNGAGESAPPGDAGGGSAGAGA